MQTEPQSSRGVAYGRPTSLTVNDLRGSVPVAITGASGALGRLAAERLLEAMAPSDVVLISRDPSKMRDLETAEAQLRRADFTQPTTLVEAFGGVDRLLLISSDAFGKRVAGHRAAVDAAVSAGVGHIAYTSITNPSDSNPAFVAAEHRATEDHIRASGVDWTFLRNSIYAETLLAPGRAAVASGKLRTNAGGGATSYVARADCAAAAVAVLTSKGHSEKVYDITGPEALNAASVAGLLSSATGRAVSAEHVDDDAWIATMIDRTGLPRETATIYSTFGVAARHGYLGAVSEAVLELTRRAPATARSVLESRRTELAI